MFSFLVVLFISFNWRMRLSILNSPWSGRRYCPNCKPGVGCMHSPTLNRNLADNVLFVQEETGAETVEKSLQAAGKFLKICESSQMHKAAHQFYQFGSFRVDAQKCLLWRGDQLVSLTPKAFDILLALLAKHGEVLSKEELMQAVWPDAVVEENNLTRNISTLRKVLGEKPDEHHYVVTVPGCGYRFVAEVEQNGAKAKPVVEESAVPASMEAMPPTMPTSNSPVGHSKRVMTSLSVFALLVTISIGVGRWHYLRQEKAAAVEQLHFKADFYLNRLTEHEVKRGIEYFNQAIALDPNSAAAYAGLSGAWIFLSDLYIPPREAMPLAKVAALHALQRDEQFASAHISMGIIKMRYEWDWIGAEHEFKQAVALDPKDDIARYLYGSYLIAVGRFDEAQAEMKRAVELNPVEQLNLLGLGHSFYFAHQFEQSIEQYRRAIGVEPKSRWSHISLGQAYAQQGNFSEAIAELSQARQLNDIPMVLALLGHAYAVSGQRAEAEKILAELQEIARQRYVSPYDVATIYARLGEKEQALIWLEKAYGDRSGNLAMYLKVDPKFDHLRDDPRFRNLLRRVGLN